MLDFLDFIEPYFLIALLPIYRYMNNIPKKRPNTFPNLSHPKILVINVCSLYPERSGLDIVKEVRL